MSSNDSIRYKRTRFTTRLPTDRLYTASHFWLREMEPGDVEETATPGALPGAGVWRVGFTRFATRMLGELVEHDFEVKPGDSVTVGQVIGWVEGFKAASDLYCVVEGEFLRGNPALAENLETLATDHHGEGWLYEVRGTPEPSAVDVHGYTGVLDAAIDKVQGKGE